jgi:xanthine dehydrogenase small subunit
MSGPPSVVVNSARRAVVGVEPHVSALDWLRAQGLTGAKEGCAEGECGACSVLVARPDPAGGPGTRWTALNSCLIPVLALDGQEVVTVEGLAPDRERLHPVQRELAVRGGSQCGYCTPGFVVGMADEYYRPDRAPSPARTDVTGNGVTGNGDRPDDPEVGPNGFDLHALSGNLCRCTGYRPIRDAAYALGRPAPDDPLATRRAAPAPAAAPTRVRADGPGGSAEFVRPADLAGALALLAERPDATVVAGCTDWGVEVNLRGTRVPLVVAVDRLPELRGFTVTGRHVELGAALTLSEIEHLLAGRVPMLAALLPQFASRPIRNAATLGGNLSTGSPIGDAAPALLALAATVLLTGPDRTREVPPRTDHRADRGLAGPGWTREVSLTDFFTGYRRTVRRPDELITAIRIPLPLAPLTGFTKIAKRRFDDISAVAVACALQVDDGVVTRAAIGLGGVAATPLRATATEAALLHRPWTAETVDAAAAVLRTEGSPLDDHRAGAAYRAAMLGESLLKFHADHPAGR